MQLRYEEIFLSGASSNELETVERLVSESPHATIYHSISWNRLIVDLLNVDCIYGIAFTGEEPAGLIYFYLEEGSLLSPKYDPFDSLYGGPVYLAAHSIKIAEFILKSTEKKYRSHNLIFRFSPSLSRDIRHLYRGCVEMNTAIIDLDVGKDAYWRNLKKNVRRDIRLSERRGVKVRLGEEKDYSGYYEMRSRALSFEHEDDIIGKNLFIDFMKLGIKKEIMRFLVAEFDGKMIAGALFGVWNHKMYYHSSAFDREHGALCANDLLQWEQIGWAIDNKFNSYDMCYIEPIRYPGIAKFKMKFGDSLAPFYVVSKRSFSNKIKSRVELLFSPRKKK